jgi:hypothetical protein
MSQRLVNMPFFLSLDENSIDSTTSDYDPLPTHWDNNNEEEIVKKTGRTVFYRIVQGHSKASVIFCHLSDL